MRGLKKTTTFFQDPHMADGAETDKRKPSQQEDKTAQFTTRQEANCPTHPPGSETNCFKLKKCDLTAVVSEH